MREHFTFMGSYYESVKPLDDATRLEFYEAVMVYSLTKEKPEMSPIVEVLFNMNIVVMDIGWSKSEAGRKGGEAKGKQKKAEGKQKVSKPKQTEANANGEERRGEDRSTITNDFALFWSAYPKKVNKGTAEKAFNKLHKELPDIKKLIELLELKKNSEQWKKDNGQYIPHASTWLNAKGWEDEAHPVNNVQQGGKMMGGYYVQ